MEQLDQGLDRQLRELVKMPNPQGKIADYRNLVVGLVGLRFLAQRWERGLAQHVAPAALTRQLGFSLPADQTWTALVAQPEPTRLSQMLAHFATEPEPFFKDLFKPVNLQSKCLGSTATARQAALRAVIAQVDDLTVSATAWGTVADQLITRFAWVMQKQREAPFYTPQTISAVLAGVIGAHTTTLDSVYDPTMGTASLLLALGHQVAVDRYVGQEVDEAVAMIGRLNLLLHGVSYQQCTTYLGDVLTADQAGTQQFSAVIANPPYSVHWAANPAADDPRFAAYDKLPPKSKADLAFIEQMVYHLDDAGGVMAVALPHGVLFRQAAEGAIRRTMIERDNLIDAVIGLPANLFPGTTLPMMVLVLKKHRTTQDIFFMDASKLGRKGKNQTVLTAEQVERIVTTYRQRVDVPNLAHVASAAEVAANQYNLNIPRYVDTYVGEPPVDLQRVTQELQATQADLARTQQAFNQMLGELAEKLGDPQKLADLQQLLKKKD